MTATARDVARLCDTLTRRSEIKDFPDARNGLQHRGDRPVRLVGAAVDAGTGVFDLAAKAKVDFLIVHHGIHWKPTLRGPSTLRARKVSLARHGLSLYSSHLPLDAHPQLGNNALIARRLRLEIERWFLDHEGTPIAALCHGIPRATLARRLRKDYPRSFTAIEHGSAHPRRIAILSGSGRSALPHLKSLGCDTLVTGELREEHFNDAHEQGWNLYPCGHYATETWGVKALAAEVARRLGIDWKFIPTGNPL
jgi:dinuclear metal center YbgI/SA1388 family protein